MNIIEHMVFYENNMEQIIPYEEVRDLLINEDAATAKIIRNRAKIETSKSSIDLKNKFKTKIKGFVIEDTYNNILFPINDVRIDDSAINIQKIFKRFQLNYDSSGELMLPWHYIFEFYNDEYIVYNTRPISLSYPYTLKELNSSINKDRKLNTDTETFLNNKSLDLKSMIYICILGDTTKDVYNNLLYNKIVDYVLSPISKIYIIKTDELYFCNVGINFNTKILKNNFKR